ncbi:MAG TPA: molecular chaperone HtpG [Edaphocola sp.]|nr:molecular chaperone HtpG [Edaphocola sp.]
MVQEKGTISIHTENIFPIIKKFLYSDNEIFLRELVSNSVDACQKLKRLSSLGEVKGEIGEMMVDVEVNKEAKTIVIKDNGIGMTAEEIKKYINQIAFSGATEFVEKFKEAKDANEIIGKFGLGFYSAFMVADTVEIDTLSYQEAAEPAHWDCDGSTTFEISEGKRTERGTTITLHINEESLEFLEEARISTILNKYCRFLQIPIRFGEKTEHVEDGTDEEGKTKYKEVSVDNIINDTHPIWTKAPTELSDEDYLKFYRELYPMSDDPLFWIHLNVDFPFTLTGVLYFPKIKEELELQRNKIKLYSRQVFITEEVKDIVPEFLMMLHGVIDSPDIPLNVSRSFLQADGNVKKINSYITKKVAEKLGEMFKKDRKVYEEKWNDIGLFVKYGMISEEKFYDKAKDFALLQNIKNEYYTLPEYSSKVAPTQTDKNGDIVYLYSNQPDIQSTYIQNATSRDYDVLKMDGPLDNHLISQLENKLEKTKWKRVDAEVMDKLIEKEHQYESVLSQEQQDAIKSLFEQTIKKETMNIEVTAMSPEEMPVTITMDEFMRRMKDMSKMGGGMMNFYGSLPDNYKVSINSNSPLIQKIADTKEEATKEQLSRQAFDLAMLSHGLLKGNELNDFVKRSFNLL